MKKKLVSVLVCAALTASCTAGPAQAFTAQNNGSGSTNERNINVLVDMVVDGSFEGKDGSTVNQIKTYKTVEAALKAAPKKSATEFKILIKKGTYKEKLKIEKPNITLIGEDSFNTILTYDDAAGTLQENGKAYGISGSASVIISSNAPNFKAVNLTVENTFDESNADISDKNAIALRNEADKSIFVNCRFIGNENTLYVNNNATQYYYNCYVEGDIDIIFGNATAVFDKCEIFSVDRNGLSPKGYVTAPTTKKGRLGFLILNSALTSDINEDQSVYLGRAWEDTKTGAPSNLNTIYSNTYAGSHVISHDLGIEEGNEDYSKDAFLNGWDVSADINELNELVRDTVVNLPGSETPEVPESPEAPEIPEVPEIPETPEVPEQPEIPEQSEEADLTGYNMVVDRSYTGVNGEVVNNVLRYNTLTSAVSTVSSSNKTEVKIFIKKGTYKEKVTIDKPNVTIVGEDPNKTIITYDAAAGTTKLPEHGGDGTAVYGTSGSASVSISSKAVNFNAVNITFENSFDEKNSSISNKQAVALKNEADKSTFVNCRFIGNQDTLYANKNVTQHYYKCYIEGDVDYIFGSATAIFEECELFTVDRAGISPKGYITAPSTEEGRLGYLILNSKLNSNVDLEGSIYLGRPWHPSSSKVPMNSNTIYMNTNMGPYISAKGWDSMSGVRPENNDMFEYGSTGRGALNVEESRRVLTDEEAQGKFSREAFFGGWDNSSVVSRLLENVQDIVVDLTEDDMSGVERERAADLVVDAKLTGKDGSIVDGVKTYKSLSAAISTISDDNEEEIIIFVKNGVYKEKLTISKPNVTLIGEDSEKTILTYDAAAGTVKAPEHGGDGSSTYGLSGSASTTIEKSAKNFTAVNITFENSFDENANKKITNIQAAAIKNEADNSLFTKCRFISNQATLYANQDTKQYYYECYIEGDVDVILGSATAVFEKSQIHIVDRKGINPKGYIVTPSTKAGNKGFLIVDSSLTSDVNEEGSVFLGRPWKSTERYDINANAVFRECDMGSHISANGWGSMSGFTPEQNTLREYNNAGAGDINNDNRPHLSDEEAKEYTRNTFMNGFDVISRFEELDEKITDLNNDFQYNIEISVPEEVEVPEVPEIPEEKPEIPEEKPEIPEEKPEIPEEKPEIPEEKPEIPEEKPEIPEEKPEIPEEKPEIPEEKPEIPEEKPEIPEEKPEIPEEKPEIPEEKPEIPEEKPEIPEEKPEIPEEKPEIPEEKPEIPEEKPEIPEEKPEIPEEKPEIPEEKPEIPEEKPEIPQEKPEIPEEKPEKPSKKPHKHQHTPGNHSTNNEIKNENVNDEVKNDVVLDVNGNPVSVEEQIQYLLQGPLSYKFNSFKQFMSIIQSYLAAFRK